MAKRTKKHRGRNRSIDQQIATLESRVADLRVHAGKLKSFSGDAVRRERERLELSARDYAELVGVAMITIYSWEHGKSKPQAGQLEKWIEVKGISKEAAWKKLGIEEVPDFSGKAVRAERDRLGLSAKKYADLMGVSMLTVYNWEKGKSMPRGKGLDKWLAVKGMDRSTAARKLGL